MPLTAAPTAPGTRDAAAANEAIRRYVLDHGDRPWNAAERAELDRLRRAWLAAVRGKSRTAGRS
ncbi:hypothetical protein [Streptomyces sp. 7-21]|uniref:hypothetical protein n=1 Tax=Streptomyces sp. 7-21 TaxID=2802283 RepID=UPI00191DE723|nr:hypothetical protein [Streptomyces sp. 7-21]MBL1066932.1 hypothetical protein [Streptomyces sp. 7-21]